MFPLVSLDTLYHLTIVATQQKVILGVYRMVIAKNVIPKEDVIIKILHI
jgi:hypothetical protein